MQIQKISGLTVKKLNSKNLDKTGFAAVQSKSQAAAKSNISFKSETKVFMFYNLKNQTPAHNEVVELRNDSSGSMLRVYYADPGEVILPGLEKTHTHVMKYKEPPEAVLDLDIQKAQTPEELSKLVKYINMGIEQAQTQLKKAKEKLQQKLELQK